MPHLGEASFFWQYPTEALTAEEIEYYKVNAQDMSAVFESMFTTGVTPQFAVDGAKANPQDYIGSSLAVVAAEGLTVTVSQGTAMIKGHPYIASMPIGVAVYEGINDIMLQMDTSSDKPVITVVARRRTGGTILDQIRHEALVYEIALATVTVPVGSISINPTMITDHRLNMTLHPIDNKPIAGIMQPKPSVGTLGIWEDWDRLNEYIVRTWQTFIGQSTDEWARFITDKNGEWSIFKTTMQTEFGQIKTNFNSQITQNQQDFTSWFNSIQGMLEGDVAAELAGKVAKLQIEKSDKTYVDTQLAKKADKTAIIALEQKDIEQDTIIANKANKSVLQTATLEAASWVGSIAPYAYTLTVSGVTATNVVEILPESSITAESLEALQGANLQDGGQSAGEITLKAYGDKPSASLPIRIVVRGDM